MEKIIPWGLLIAQLKHESTPEQDVLFDAWIKETDNAGLFADITLLWDKIQEEVSEAKPDLAVSWEKMQTRIHAGQHKQRNLRRIKYSVISIAASILLLLGIGYSYQFVRQYNTNQYYSALNGKSKIILPDSSVVWLNTGSTLQYASSFIHKRQLVLEGEASFEATKDKRHPFIVSSGDLKVKVYGTKFNVYSYPNDNNAKIALRSGSVSVSLKDGKEAFLSPGEIARINKKEQTLKIEQSDVELETFWAKESVFFKSKSLGYICKYLERWYNVKINVDPKIAESQFYTFTVKDDSLETILRTLSKINPIKYTFDDNNRVTISSVEP